MKAMYYDRFGQAPEIRSVADPKPSDDGVVIKVEATGLCRSDWHGWMGHDPDINLPHVPGHELAGVIVETGKGVLRYRKGQRVTVPFVSGCGRCGECHSGNAQVCANQFQPGFTHWGSFAEYVAIDYADHNIVPMPDNLDFATAASLGCRFATSFRAIVDQGRVKGGEWVAIHGCGGVGLSAIMIATALGANVVAIDISEDKLAFARKIGAVATINGRETPDVAEAVREITGGGAHLSIDALGSPVTCFNSIKNLRRRGRHVQVGLMLGEHASPQIPMAQVISNELEIYGSHGMQAWRYQAMMAMLETGKLKPQILIGRHISLEEAVPALMAMDTAQDIGISVITRF
ncbi:zinc-dependent alcohol dehydrogenase family protein [Pararhizobium sp.]|uniref:zinc-dependent alcohol dehydrogenase family protein n=1 Tax=Pararhizobium sp. TaxID=1977563 RepID=UPI002718E4B2|nr:zinc-dependent alcohol dehydrogenase family protein [Pararhizobium sp.]MDO9417241.1 zinc-dependent alcohol dehydrogenase family protein [Pararhizobium sp.]